MKNIRDRARLRTVRSGIKNAKAVLRRTDISPEARAEWKRSLDEWRREEAELESK